MTPTLRTRRLKLRAYTLEDAPAMQSLLDDPEIADYTLTIPHPLPEGFAEARIRRDLEREGETSHAWGLFLLETAEKGLPQREGLEQSALVGHPLVGHLGLSWDPKHKRGGVGYWLARAARRRGLMTEAVREVVRYGFENLGLHRLEANHFPRNPASGRVLEKAGFVREGLLRGAVWKGEKPEDVIQYAILSTDLNPELGANWSTDALEAE